MTASTPVRSANLKPPSTIDDAADPFAAGLLHVLDEMQDLSSWSDEIPVSCRSWHDSYHLSSARANVLRALELPKDAVVLEIGAGGGAVTRYLGETFATVDAVEPDPAMASVAARRCVDLTSVMVHAAWVDEVPVAPTYDVIVALDVMAELAMRGQSLNEFAATCRSLLSPRGILIIAADNRDGVRLVAGDLTPVLKPQASHRPTGVAVEGLRSAIGLAGQDPLIMSAFPDHRHSRTVFRHEALAALDATLLTELPSFPSPPLDHARPSNFPEAQLWAESLEAGTGHLAANGIVAVSSARAVEPGSVASYWSMGRRAALSASNTIMAGSEGAVVRRSRTFPHAPAADIPLQLRPHTEPLMQGTPLTHRLAETEDLATATALLRSWSSLVEHSASESQPLCWDLIPRNVLITGDGEFRAFDQEWVLEPVEDGADLVRSRGAFWLAHDLLFRFTSPPWLTGATVGQSADFLLRLSQSSPPAHWFDTFLDRESTHMSYVWPTTSSFSQPAAARRERKNVSALSNTNPPRPSGEDDSAALHDVIDSLTTSNTELRDEIEKLRLEKRHAALVHRDHALGLVASTEALRDRLERSHAVARRNKARTTQLTKQLAAVKASSTWRVGSMIVRPFSRLSRMIRR